MWHTLTNRSTPTDERFVASTNELLQSASRSLIVVIAGAYLLLTFATVVWPKQIGTPVFLIMPMAALACGLPLLLLQKHYLAAHVVLQAGLAVVIALMAHLFRMPQLVLLFAILPFIAVLAVGWPLGVLSEVFIAGALACLVGRALPSPLTWGYGLAAVLAGAFMGFLGWTSARSQVIVAEWSLFSFQQAMKNLEETRERRAELARLVKELDRAYSSLERANHMLVLARSEAEEARDARNRLALAISHELRTPLNFIIGFSELMVNSPGTYGDLANWPPDLYEDIQEIYRSSSHLLRLVNDVLDLGEIESLEMALIKEWIEPAQMLREVEEMLRPAFARKRLYLHVEIEPNLPRLFVDSTRVRQVLLNLASNALRFTETGGVTIRVARQDDHILFTVQDTGPGIPPEDVERIFEPFQQVRQSQWRRQEGAGLGLAISRRFIEQHGGRMWAESEPGAGARFLFLLPLPQASRLHAASAVAQAADDEYWRRLREKAEREQLVLVVSRQPDAGEVIKPFVEGYRVYGVQTLEETPRCVSELLPSAILLDQALAAEDGFAAMLQALPYDLPVIRFTLPGNSIRAGSLPEGAAGYLVKPVERAALLSALESLGPGVRRILVVDDDPAMVRFVVRALSSAQPKAGPQRYQVQSALTGAKAREQVQETRPDAALLDLALPDISGWQLLREFAQQGIPSVLLTAFENVRAREEHQDALGINMRRPLTRAELGKVLSFLLQSLRPSYPHTGADPKPQ